MGRGNAAPCNQKVLHSRRIKGSVRNLVPFAFGQSRDSSTLPLRAVDVYGVRAFANCIIELAAAEHIIFCKLISPLYGPALPHPDLGSNPHYVCVFESRHLFLQPGKRFCQLPAGFKFCFCEFLQGNRVFPHNPRGVKMHFARADGAEPEQVFPWVVQLPLSFSFQIELCELFSGEHQLIVYSPHLETGCHRLAEPVCLPAHVHGNAGEFCQVSIASAVDEIAGCKLQFFSFADDLDAFNIAAFNFCVCQKSVEEDVHTLLLKPFVQNQLCQLPIEGTIFSGIPFF